MRKYLLNPSAFTLLAVCALLSIMLAGGCPAPQTPTTPDSADDAAQNTSTTPTTTDNGLDRPIQQPDYNGDTTVTGSEGSGQDNSGNSGNSGSGNEVPSQVSITIDTPLDDIMVAAPPRVAQGTTILIGFDVEDQAGQLTGGELLLARDDNTDGQPDGDPVYTQTTALSAGSNVWSFDTLKITQNNLLTNNYGRFVLGVRAHTITNDQTELYSVATITVDGIAPTVDWIGAGPSHAAIDKEDHLVTRNTNWTVEIGTADNSPHSWQVFLDMDMTPGNGNEFELVPETTLPADVGVRTPPYPLTLLTYPASTYYYYVIVTDGIDPAATFYAEAAQAGEYSRVAVTNRLIGDFELEQLTDAATVPSDSKGAIVEGFNYNDLAGSSMVSVPDMDGDGDSELVIGARFGKPNLQSAEFEGRGWGQAYMIYGDGAMRLTGVQSVNSIGGNVPGLRFRGIRTRQNNGHTEGLSDITVIDDMDGDDLPELVFSFPRVESLALKAPAPYQHPDLIRDIADTGNLEYDAIDYNSGTWVITWLSSPAAGL